MTDGTRLNLNPQVTRHVYPHHLVYLDQEKREALPAQWVCGHTCMEYDKLFPLENAPVLIPGDRSVYDLAGGYTMALSPLFIRYFPAVYVKKADGSLQMVRERWTAQEYLHKNTW